MRRSIHFTFIIFLLLCVSCRKESPVSPDLPQTLLPLTVGDWWVMRDSAFDTTGRETWFFRDSVVVFDDTLIAGDRWFLTTWGNYTAFANRNDGVWMAKLDWNYNLNAWFFDTASLVFKYPADVGDQWASPWGGTSMMSLVSRNAAVEVPHGTHTCHLYRIAGIFYHQQDYYVEPGLGIVAEKYYDRTLSGREYLAQSSALLSYNAR